MKHYLPPEAEFLFALSGLNFRRCIPDKIHKGKRYKLSLKVPCHWIIPFSKDSLLPARGRTSDLAGENDSLVSSMRLKYSNGCASPAWPVLLRVILSFFCSAFCLRGATACRQFPSLLCELVSSLASDTLGRGGAGSRKNEEARVFLHTFSASDGFSGCIPSMSLACVNSTPAVPASTR